MPKLIFKTAPAERIAEFIFDLKDTLEENALREQEGEYWNTEPCIFVPLPSSLKKELLLKKKLTAQLKLKIGKAIKNFVKEDCRKAKRLLHKVKKYWNNNIAGIYFKEVEKLLKHKFRAKYFCYATNAVVAAYFGKNAVTFPHYEGSDENRLMSEVTFTIAEELLHLIYWEKWGKIFNKKFMDEIYEGKKWSAWHISELIPLFVLIENPAFIKLGWNKERREKYYRWTPELKKVLSPLWKKRKSFDSFIIKAHKACGCLPKN